MTDEQYAKLQALSRCTFRPGSYDKRFVRHLSGQPPEMDLSERQAQYIEVLYWRYRGQLRFMDGVPPIPDEKVEMPAREIPAALEPAACKSPGRWRQERARQQAEEALERWNRSVEP